MSIRRLFFSRWTELTLTRLRRYQEPEGTSAGWRTSGGFSFSLHPQPKARSCNGIQLSVSGSIVPPNYHRCLAFIVPSHTCATGLPHNSGSKGIVMGTVMIRCPKTSRAISTGIRTDVATFQATPVFFSQVLCPLCGLTHEWFAKDAWICDLVVCSPHSDHCACE